MKKRNKQGSTMGENSLSLIPAPNDIVFLPCPYILIPVRTSLLLWKAMQPDPPSSLP